MGKLNRHDKILLQCNNSYSIRTNIKIFGLMNTLFPTENYDDFQLQEVTSNESFGFLYNDRIDIVNSKTNFEEVTDINNKEPEEGNNLLSSLLDLSTDNDDGNSTHNILNDNDDNNALVDVDEDDNNKKFSFSSQC